MQLPLQVLQNHPEFLDLPDPELKQKLRITDTLIAQVGNHLSVCLYPRKTNDFGISLSVCPCLCLSVCLSVYKILVSVKALAGVLTLSQTSPGFYVSAMKVF